MTLKEALAIADAYAAQSNGKIAKPGSLDKLQDSTAAGFAALSKRYEGMLAKASDISRQLEKLEANVAFLEASYAHDGGLGRASPRHAALAAAPVGHPLEKLRMMSPGRLQ